VRRALIAAAVLASALAAGVDRAGATNECRGLNPCVPVHGPWVVVPVARSVPRPEVQYQLTCPRGYVVGGVDAEVTDRAIDVAFLGKTGSPINPGITTSRTVVFVATYTGAGGRAATFRPHAGCTTAGGGGRTPTVVSAVSPPGQPALRRARTVRVAAGTTRRIVETCRPGERLVAAYHARGFFTAQPPPAAGIARLSAAARVRRNGVVVTARAGTALRGMRAVVQVAVVCTGGR
jgi:hypothetical protein